YRANHHHPSTSQPRTSRLRPVHRAEEPLSGLTRHAHGGVRLAFARSRLSAISDDTVAGRAAASASYPRFGLPLSARPRASPAGSDAVSPTLRGQGAAASGSRSPRGVDKTSAYAAASAAPPASTRVRSRSARAANSAASARRDRRATLAVSAAASAVVPATVLPAAGTGSAPSMSDSRSLSGRSR